MGRQYIWPHPKLTWLRYTKCSRLAHVDSESNLYYYYKTLRKYVTHVLIHYTIGSMWLTSLPHVHHSQMFFLIIWSQNSFIIKKSSNWWSIYKKFVCLEIFVPLKIFSLTWKRHHCQWRTANFDLCSTLMAIEQWWFFSVPHLLWHGPSV